MLSQFEGQLGTRLWIAPPTKMDEESGAREMAFILLFGHQLVSQVFTQFVVFSQNFSVQEFFKSFPKNRVFASSHLFFLVAPFGHLQEQLTKEGYYSIYGKAGARTEMPGCSLCMGNQVSYLQAVKIWGAAAWILVDFQTSLVSAGIEMNQPGRHAWLTTQLWSLHLPVTSQIAWVRATASVRENLIAFMSP